jgi:hypothetical protein
VRSVIHWQHKGSMFFGSWGAPSGRHSGLRGPPGNDKGDEGAPKTLTHVEDEEVGKVGFICSRSFQGVPLSSDVFHNARLPAL